MTTEAITQLPLDQLTESPFNPRKTFTGITELVDNIRAEGRIHSPLLVRPVTPNPLRDDIISGYEVIFGHRRLRAAEAALSPSGWVYLEAPVAWTDALLAPFGLCVHRHLKAGAVHAHLLRHADSAHA